MLHLQCRHLSGVLLVLLWYFQSLVNNSKQAALRFVEISQAAHLRNCFETDGAGDMLWRVTTLLCGRRVAAHPHHVQRGHRKLDVCKRHPVLMHISSWKKMRQSRLTGEVTPPLSFGTIETLHPYPSVAYKEQWVWRTTRKKRFLFPTHTNVKRRTVTAVTAAVWAKIPKIPII